MPSSRHTRTPNQRGPLGIIRLGIAGVGLGLVLPTVSTEVMTSVPATEMGVASGTNSTLRQLGGVFGVTVLASVFSRPGVYASPSIFVGGFRAAPWVATAFSAVGALWALSALRRPLLQRSHAPAHAQPNLAHAA